MFLMNFYFNNLQLSKFSTNYAHFFIIIYVFKVLILVKSDIKLEIDIFFKTCHSVKKIII